MTREEYEIDHNKFNMPGVTPVVTGDERIDFILFQIDEKENQMRFNELIGSSQEEFL